MKTNEMKLDISSWFTVVLLFCTLSLSAQSRFFLSDCQLQRMDMTAANVFQSGAWVRTSCGNDYLLKELMHAKVDALMFVNRHAFMLQMSHHGYSRYGELTTSLAYAVKFGGKVAVGLRFHYIFQHVAHYEAQHSVCFDLSLFAKATKKISVGIEVYNPARLKYGIKGKILIPMRFTAIAVYDFSERLFFSMTIHKFLPGLFDLSLSSFYQAVNYMSMYLSLSLHYAECGIMFQYRRLYFTIDMKYNYNLGFAPEVGVLIKLWSKNKEK